MSKILTDSRRIGIILAGGKSSRFGEDKALAKVEGVSLLERTVALLNKLDLEVRVITSNARNYSFLNCAVARDVIPEKGPLGGLYTACHILGQASLLVLTCDMPWLTLECLSTLLRAHTKEAKATVFQHPEYGVLPFPGIYESSLSDFVLEKICQNELSMKSLLQEIASCQILECHFDPRIFSNINEKKDLKVKL